MLDPIIISYKLTINLSVTYSRIQLYPVKYIYNSWISTQQSWNLFCYFYSRSPSSPQNFSSQKADSHCPGWRGRPGHRPGYPVVPQIQPRVTLGWQALLGQTAVRAPRCQNSGWGHLLLQIWDSAAKRLQWTGFDKNNDYTYLVGKKKWTS